MVGIQGDEELTVLGARGVEVLQMGGGILPVDEHRDAAPAGDRVGGQALGQSRRGRVRAGEELHGDHGTGVVPRRGGRQVRDTAGREGTV